MSRPAEVALVFLGAALLAALLTFTFRSLAERLGLAVPTRTGGRMPLVGGLALFPAVNLAALALFLVTGAGPDLAAAWWRLQPLLLPFLVLGLVDDRRALKPLPKLLGFLLAALCQFAYLPFLGVPGYLALLLPLAYFFFTNSYNFLDNADGHCPVAVLGLMVAVVALDGVSFQGLFALLFATVILGFLFFNFPRRASCYLGDSGSLYLGAAALTAALLSSSPNLLEFDLVKLSALLAFPLYDTCIVMLLRVKRGQNPTIGGQDHYSHRLMRGGAPLWLVNLWTFCATCILPWSILATAGESRCYALPLTWAILACWDLFAEGNRRRLAARK